MPDKQNNASRSHTLSTEAKIFVLATQLSDYVLAEKNQLLSVWGMTALQYNALSVLYDEDKDNEGLPSREIGKRLYTRVPDVTRLLDRLADKGWVTRKRDDKNRRVVRTQLTPIGIELVESIYMPHKKLEEGMFNHLSMAKKQMLEVLLKEALNNLTN